ncbi:uncharacterized protein LOC115898781 [Rhinopithecus roxellana]|uniref:uncharacterized protein LOC115898781 n=1 Tax=Rhinopithecus roxellana TaxID=61622 RepID=UPI00123735C9|nr:uncharacterized protein LOC115898781 [Rhinopithecus roxellana]
MERQLVTLGCWRMKTLLTADIQACDRISEFHLPRCHQAWGNGDKLQSLHGLTEAEASCREISRTFKSSMPWIWDTTPAQIPPCFMQFFIADGPIFRTRNSNIPIYGSLTFHCPRKQKWGQDCRTDHETMAWTEELSYFHKYLQTRDNSRLEHINETLSLDQSSGFGYSLSLNPTCLT